MRPLLLVFIALTSVAAAAGQIYETEDEAIAQCERILTSNVKSWTREAKDNLTKIASYPIYPVTVTTRADALIATAFGLKPADVDVLEHQQMRARVEGDRLILELQNWPSFQRTQVSLRHPEVIKDFSLAQRSESHDDHFIFSVQANTRLFYPMRDLPHETQLGLVMPLRELSKGDHGHPPFFEFEIALLKPCFDDDSGEMRDQIFTGEDGASLCIDSLVTLSTWSEPMIEVE